MKFVDFFAGIGGFRKGLESSGHECVYSCEIDNNARKSYSAIYNEKGETFATDITSINAEDIPPYDMFCGGFPCQPFSRAGRRNAFNDVEKGNLFFNVIDIVRENKPKFVFLENVKGLLTSGEKDTIGNEDGTVRNIEVNKGATFRKILEELHKLGYDVQWQLINSADYIAHKRERVYIIAQKRNNEVLRRIFPIKGEIRVLDVNRAHQDLQYTYNDFVSNIERKSIKRFRIANDEMYEVLDEVATDQEKEAYAFTTTSPWGNWGLMINGNCVTCKVKFEQHTVHNLRDLLEDSNSVDAKYILSVEEVEKQRYSKSARTWQKSGNKMGNMSFPDNIDKPSRTLTANSSGREMMVIGFQKDGEQKFRKLTSLEYWKLQGFTEEDYNKAVDAGVPESQLKKQAGNAVTVDVIRAIGKRLEL